MNPICNRPAKNDEVKISGKPNPPQNQATVGHLPVKMLQNIDPQKTPVSAYTKKTK